MNKHSQQNDINTRCIMHLVSVLGLYIPVSSIPTSLSFLKVFVLLAVIDPGRTATVSTQHISVCQSLTGDN